MGYGGRNDDASVTTAAGPLTTDGKVIFTDAGLTVEVHRGRYTSKGGLSEFVRGGIV